MINKNGKLFGIINIVDLFIIIAVIGAAFFISKKMTKTTTTVSSDKVLTVKYFIEEVPQYVPAAIVVGDKVEDDVKNLALGTITNIEVGQGYMYQPNSLGELKKASKEGYNSLEITTTVKAQLTDTGFQVDGNKYLVGYGLTIRMGKAKWYMRVSSIEVQ